jgi:hypothetical protein
MKKTDNPFVVYRNHLFIRSGRREESEVVMFDINNKIGQCIVCKHEYTTIHVEATPGHNIYVCDDCLEAAKHSFIWICLNCGKVYVRAKAYMINRIQDDELRMAYLSCEDKQIIQGISICMECDPQGIINYVHPEGMEC